MVHTAQSLAYPSKLVTTRHKLGAYLTLLVIMLGNVAGSIYWIRRNVVPLGHDTAGHLERTLDIAHLLAHPTWQTLFQTITFHDLRPPIMYIFAQPFYWLFGYSAQSATLANVALLALILWLTFEFGQRWATVNVGLFAALLAGLFPMLAAMSRLFYLDNLVAALVLLNLLALLRCEAFGRRGWSLVWGLSLGLGMLAKWPYPIHILLPALFVLWQANFFPQQWQASRKWQIDWRSLGLALLLAVVLVAVWYLPNRAYARQEAMILGDALAPIWVVLLTPLLYALLRPTSRLTNVWAGGLLAVTIASLWYAPRIDFMNYLADAAFGSYGGNYQSADPLRFYNYIRYWDYLRVNHLGLLATVLLLPLGLWPWVARWRGWRTARLGSWLLWGSVLSTYLVLSFLSQDGERNLVPMLPLLALFLADGLRDYPRRLVMPLAVVWVLVLATQWTLYTFDGMETLYKRTAVLWASGEFLARPASGLTDPMNWIEPDVLQRIGNPKDEAASFGVLVDSPELHRGQFRYLINKDKLNIDLMALTENDSRGWSDLLANRWILVKDGDNSHVKEPGAQVVQRVLRGDPLFRLLYKEVKRYPLSTGETAYLYQRTEGPGHPYEYPVVLIATSKIAELANQAWSKGATLYLSNADLATWVGIHDLKADQIVMPTTDPPALNKLLDAAKGTIMAITRYDTAPVQDYLRATSYATAQETTSGEFTLAIFGRPTRPLQTLPIQSKWGGVQIIQLQTLATLYPGEVLPVKMNATGRVDGSLKLSARLVNGAGQVVAQNDQTLREQLSFGLFLPPDAPPGPYALAAVLYDPATLAPLKDRAGNDMATITPIDIQARAQ
ncbi:MAG: glycosyltransferase family 39 protein [Chloroflexi bacterium]|nr:glycosyltransferase family 39 protein [Chloroflexota bacterium]